MLRLLFNPSGTISSRAFWRGSLVIIAIVFILDSTDLLPTNSDTMKTSIDDISSGLFLLLLFPWTCLLIKRFRKGGQSGWRSVIFVTAYSIVVLITVFAIVGLLNEGFLAQLWGGPDSQMTDLEIDTYMDAAFLKAAMPIAVISAIESLIFVWFIDKITPENKTVDLFD